MLLTARLVLGTSETAAVIFGLSSDVRSSSNRASVPTEKFVNYLRSDLGIFYHKDFHMKCAVLVSSGTLNLT